MIALIALAGCGSAGTSGKSAGAKGNFTFVLSQYSNATEPYTKTLVENFMKQNPGIKVDLQVIGWDVLEQKVNTMISTNQAPDLLNLDQYARFVNDDLLMDIEKVISPELKANFYESFYKPGAINGVTYAIPILATVRGLFYNKDIFAKAGITAPPTNWSELLKTCQNIKEKTGIDALGYEMTNVEGQATLAYFFWGNGGGFKDGDKWTINRPENVEALQFMVDLANKYKVTNPKPTAIARDDLQKIFGQGKLAMLYTANFFPTVIKAEAPNLNYGFTPIPPNDGKPDGNLGVQDFLMVFKSTKASGAVGKFLDYFYQDDNYVQFLQNEGMLPTTKTGGDLLTKKDSNVKQYIDLLPKARFYPLTDPKYGELRLAMIKAAQEVFLGTKTAKNALDEVQKQADSN
jgi:multiple sugar transport system substrate-binding protein